VHLHVLIEEGRSPLDKEVGVIIVGPAVAEASGAGLGSAVGAGVGLAQATANRMSRINERKGFVAIRRHYSVQGVS
jgi:hypothetical protein